MSGAYTIRIFVADGDPEGLRIIDQLNWTGLGAAFPRHRWPDLKSDDSYNFDRPGVYLLWGFVEEDDAKNHAAERKDVSDERGAGRSNFMNKIIQHNVR